MAKRMTNIGLLLGRVRRARQALNAAVERHYPKGAFVLVDGSIVGIVHSHFPTIAEQVGVLLDLGDVRVFDVDRIQPLPDGHALPSGIHRLIENGRCA